MKFLALIFLACALQSTYADSFQDAIQKGREAVAQLKKIWESNIPGMQHTILYYINQSAEEFAEAAADVAKQVKDDAAKAKAAEDVKVAFEALIAAMKKSALKIVNSRPDVLSKQFDGAKLANAGYKKVSEMVDDMKKTATGNACKEGVVANFVAPAVEAVGQVTKCVVDGGSNFPGLPKALVDLRRSALSETRDYIRGANRCVGKVGTECFDNLLEQFNTETKTVAAIGDKYVVDSHEEIELQVNVSNFCIKRWTGVLSRQVVEFKDKMEKC